MKFSLCHLFFGVEAEGEVNPGKDNEHSDLAMQSMVCLDDSRKVKERLMIRYSGVFVDDRRPPICYAEMVVAYVE